MVQWYSCYIAILLYCYTWRILPEEEVEEAKYHLLTRFALWRLLVKIWELREAGKPFQIQTEIIRKSHPHKTGDSQCDLCLIEKTCFALQNKAPKKLMTLPVGCQPLNIRIEIMNSCPHKIDYRLIGRKTNRQQYITTGGPYPALRTTQPRGPQSQVFFIFICYRPLKGLPYDRMKTRKKTLKQSAQVQH